MSGGRGGGGRKPPDESGGVRIDGARAVAEMLDAMEPAAREKLIADLARRDPAVAAKVSQKMFLFSDLLRLDAQSLTRVLREFPNEKIALSLRDLPSEFADRILAALPTRAADTIRAEMTEQGPQLVARIRQVQEEIAGVAHRLLRQGEAKVLEVPDTEKK